MATIPYADKTEEQKNKKLLPKDQQNLANAAKVSSQKGTDNSSALDTTMRVANNAIEYGGVDAVAGAALKQFGTKVAMPRVALLGASTMTYAPHMAAAAGGIQLGRELDKTYGISDKIGEKLGPILAKLQGVNTNTGPFTQEELTSAKGGGNNIVQPAFDKAEIASNKPMVQKSQQELTEAAQVNLGGQFEGSASMPDGSTKGYLADGKSKTMTPEEISAFEQVRKTGEFSAVPMGDYNPVAGTNGSVQLPQAPNDLNVPTSKEELEKQFAEMRQGSGTTAEKEAKSKELMSNYFASQSAANQGNQSPDQGSGMNELESKMLSDFENFKNSGREMTPEMENKAKLLASSVGRNFDSDPNSKDYGYNKEFSPEIMRIYNEAVDSGEVDPVRYRKRDDLKAAGQEMDERQSKSKAEYESNKVKIREEVAMRDSANNTKIRVGGEMVYATPENRSIQQQEKALGSEADREGLKGAEKKQFIADGIQERNNSSYDSDVKIIKDQLDISTAEADLELKRRKLLPEAPERPDPSKVSKFIDTAKDLGLTYDAETGLFREDDTGTFTDDILNPSSPKYAQLQKMEGSEFFLQPPSDVMDNYEELTTIAKTDKNGYARAIADDGRIFKIYSDGNYEHTGYQKP